MKSILILSDSFNGYGAEHILKWLGNSLYEAGLNVTFCSIFDTEKNKELNEEVEYYQMCFPKDIYDKYYFLKGICFIRNLCEKRHFDYLVTFHTNPFLMAFLAKPFGSYKIIHSERDNPYARNTKATHFKMWLYRFADRVVFQTRGAQEYFDKRTQKESVIIANPIEIPDFKWEGECSKTISTVGRLWILFKRQDILIEAFRKVLEKYPDYKLKLYGDGQDRGKLESMVEKYGIAANVFFLGKVNNVQNHLKDDEIFVLTSDSEGMPNALMEAMALGMPVISTDCEPGGARALINDGVDGFLVKRSSVDGLTTSLLKLIGDREMQKRLGNNAREKMKQFTPELVFKQWLACFK